LLSELAEDQDLCQLMWHTDYTAHHWDGGNGDDTQPVNPDVTVLDNVVMICSLGHPKLARSECDPKG